MRWKLYCMLPLCVALGFAEAQSATININETVRYNFVFDLQDGLIDVDPFADWFDECCFDIRYRLDDLPNTGRYAPYITLGFWHYGSQAIDFEGQTFDLQDLFSSPPDQIEEAYYDFVARPDYAGPNGYITFGEDNSIADWYIGGHLPVAGEGESHSANAGPIPDWWNSVNFDSFAGREVYGFGQYNDSGGTFWTNPGRWTTSIQRICYHAEDGSQVPCPDPVPPLNGCGPSGGVPPNCDTVALVPLPPSVLLLASGLAGVGALRRRRARPAGWSSPQRPSSPSCRTARGQRKA